MAVMIGLEETAVQSSTMAGLDDIAWSQLKEWQSRGAAVTLRLAATRRTSFLRKETRTVDSGVSFITETLHSLFGESKETKKVQSTVDEWWWNRKYEWSVTAYAGTFGSDDTIRLVSGSGAEDVVTNTKAAPGREVDVVRPLEVELTWLLKSFRVQKLTSGQDGVEKTQLVGSFAINRMAETCRTPRRNDDIDEAMKFYFGLYNWASNVHAYFTSIITSSATVRIPPDAFQSAEAAIFNPLLPLFENPHSAPEAPVDAAVAQDEAAAATPQSPVTTTKQRSVAAKDHSTSHVTRAVNLSGSSSSTATVSSSLLLSENDNALLLSELRRSFGEALSTLLPVLDTQKAGARLLSAGLLRLLLGVRAVCGLAAQWSDGVNYVEDQLRAQLLAAVGRVLTPSDFDNYMRYHAKKVFRPEFQPHPFSYAVRRDTEAFPEGSIAIEAASSTTNPLGDSTQTVETFVRQLPSFPMRFRINAATSIEFGGERLVHTMLLQSFSGTDSLSNIELVARARQFSSFLLLLGKLSGPDELDIRSALLVKNGDELRIPLLCETLPSAKAFRDAIESLSPEQQRFARAYRAMQLDSSVFALVTVQVKPQVERVLLLQPQTLTKEIRLMQDVMDLFVQYQIPPDMLAYDAIVDGSAADANQRITAVKSHVTAIRDIISSIRQAQMDKAKEHKAYRQAQEMELHDAPSFSYHSAMLVGNIENDPLYSFKLSEDAGSDRQAVIAERHPAHHPSTADDVHVPNDGGDIIGLPSLLDKAFETYDVDGSVRPTLISTGPTWAKKSSEALLAGAPALSFLSPSEQDVERAHTFELLDALSRSGALVLESATVHIVVAATHAFDKTLIDTVIQENVNPIEKLERTQLIMQTVMHQKTPQELVKAEALERLQKYSAPAVFADAKGTKNDRTGKEM